MNSEQENKLLEDLAQLGFTGSKLKSKLLKNLSLNLPGFAISHVMPFDQDSMFFDFYFAKSSEQNVYRLEQYKVTIHEAFDIDHKVINGVDTRLLEDRMQGQDWNTFFNDFELLHSSTKAYMGESVEMLQLITKGNDEDGSRIQAELISKYWPDPAYDHPLKQSLKESFQREHHFVRDESGIANINLAYHITSGGFQDLLHNLSIASLRGFPGEDVDQNLKNILGQNPDSFKLNYSAETPEGLIEFTIPVAKFHGWYSADKLQASLTLNQPEHPAEADISTVNSLKRTFDFAINTDTKEAFNLLCGRAVLNDVVVDGEINKDKWLRLDLNKSSDHGNCMMVPFTGLNISELEAQVDFLPLDQADYYMLKYSLKRGDEARMKLKDGREVLAVANPEHHTVNVYTPDKRLIPLNLRFDPDWKPTALTAGHHQRASQTFKKRNSGNRGKRL